MFQRQPLTIAILAASLGLAACNSNDHDNVSTSASTTTITVTPSLGKILSGRVVLRDAKTGVDLAPAKTLTPADNGTATFTVPIAKLAEPVVAAVLPNLQGKVDYADEAIPNQVTTITVANTDINKPIIRSAASLTPNSNLGVTALTEAAVQQAEKASGGLIAQNINQANAAVKNQLKLNFDITQAPIVVGLGEFDKLINQALDQQRRTYAAYLATLAKESKRLNPANTQPAFDMAKAFAADFSDGTFDGKEGLTALTIYNSQFITAWSNWVQTFYSQFIQFNTLAALNTWVGNFNAEQPTNSNTCTSQGSDDTLGFASAPNDFCGFHKLSSTAISSPDIYTFVNGSANVKVTVENASVSKVLAENNTYAFSCGLGGTNPTCSGVTFKNGANTKEFIFNNTVLAPLSGQGQSISVKNGSLIHQISTTSGNTNSISFSKTGTSMVAADIAPLVGVYQGTLGRVFAAGQSTIDTTSCTITVTADGNMTVSAGGKSFSAAINGDVGDLILPVVDLHRIMASDVANDRYVQVTTVRGYVGDAVARQGGFGFSDALNRVECVVTNPHQTTAGTSVLTTINNGVTASNVPQSFVGTYSNDSCSVSVGVDGKVHLIFGSVDETVQLGGDQNDSSNVFPTINTDVLTATDYRAGGKQIAIELAKAGDTLSVSARVTEPRPQQVLVGYPNCQGMTKKSP